jgi:outer membrane lipoprotein
MAPGTPERKANPRQRDEAGGKEMNRVGSFHLKLLLLVLSLCILFSGCASVISRNLRDQADLALTFQQVFQDPEAYKGKIVIWGGNILRTKNQKDRTTLIEVLQKPLDWEEEPKDTGSSEGRFLVLVDHFLDPYVFRGGRKITVAGEILGERTTLLGEMEYRYPYLLGKQIYLWTVNYEEYSPPPPYPWGYYGLWGYRGPAWWSYPYYPY